MNRDRYRTVFSKRLGTLVAVAETTKAQGKGSGSAPGSGARVSHQPGASRFIGRRGAVSTAVAFALWGHAAFASPPLPTGGEITSGTGTISQSSNTLTVNQSSQSLAANWQSFDIDADHAVVFNQPNSSSIALNRVIGPDASAIYGSLSANGKVFLVNPNGVLFAPGAQVSVGGLVASTLKISDEDFAAGRYRFTEGSGAGSVVNEGSIEAGSVALIGPKVVNNGTVQTQDGRTTFAAGDQVTVSLLDGLLTAQVDAAVAGAEIRNHGQIIANGGQVHLLAGRADTVLDTLINTDGVIQANSIRSENGKIYLDGGAGGTVYVSGALDASASNGGDGGEVRVLGDRVTLDVDARVDVSGSRDGGTALIGGDFQGKNPDVANANVTTVAAGASIRADGAERGGRVIVWADDTTRFAGEISALGKGFAEVSGKGALSFSGSVDTGGGTLFLDPPNITVQNTAGDLLNTFSGSQIATLLASNDLILNADIDITWNANATLDYNGIGSTGRTLTLQAGNNIAFNGDIVDGVAGGDSLNVLLNSDWDANGIGGINVATFASIVTSGGDITLRGGIAAFDPLPSLFDPNYSTALGATAARNISLGTATLNAGGGNITMRGIGVGSNSAGVFINGTTIRTSGAGTITLDGIGGSGVSFNPGVGTLGAANISTVEGALTVQGIGGGTGIENAGVRHNGGIYQTTGSGNLIINSMGATSSDYNDGMVIDGAILRVNNGNLIATGIGRGTGVGSDGIELANSALVEATGTGNVTFDGTSISPGFDTNRGVTVWIGSTVRTTSGALTLQGASPNPANGNAISVDANGTVGGVGQTGAITLTGDSMNFASGAIRGSGSLLLQPLTPAASIGLGDGAAGTLNLTAAEIGLLQNGFSSITIGRGDSSGAVDVRTAAFLDPLTIRTPAGSGDIAVNGALSTGAGTSSGDITLLAADAISLAAGTINTANALNLTGASYAVSGSSALTSNALTFGNINSISNTGTLTLNQASNTTLANDVVGAGGNLTKSGTNTLTLTGANSYTGTTTISAGTLQVGAGGTAGTLGTGAIANNGALTFNRSDTTTYSGVISGSGSLTQAGSGTLVLSGDNTYGGTTTISAGTLQVGNGGTTGTLGTGNVVDNGTLTFNRSNALTVSNVISGSGDVVKAGAGTTTLAGTNTYAGTTAVNAGTLAVTNAAALGDTTGGTAVAAGASLDLQNVAVGAESVTLAGGALRTSIGTSSLSGAVTLASSSDIDVGAGAELTVSGVISGSGGLTKAGSGTLVLTAANTYTGSTTVNIGGGTLAVTNDSALGSTSAGVNLRSGGTLDLRNVTIAETITTNGGGVRVSTGASTLSGNVGPFSSMPIDVLDGAQLTMSGVIGTATSLIKNGGGTLTLTGNNTSNGATTINAGTMRVGDGGTTGTLTRGAVTVASGANLVFDRSDSVSLSTLANNAAGITGAGNVTALIGGDFNVDRPIALSGASSSILLEAGKSVPAGTVAGGNVTLSSNVSTSATGTLTIFSGNATTAAYEAMVSGADGATRYKTYGASASDTTGAIAGTRNYYYRQQPSALTVSGLTATRMYDGLLDATAALDSTGAIVNGAIDGDNLAVTLLGAQFDSAHAGPRTLSAVFSGPVPTYSSGGTTWSTSGYSSANVMGSGTGTITPRSISTSIDPIGRAYNGLTSTTSTLAAPTGLIGNDSATSVVGLLLAFDNPNAGTRNVVASGTGVLTGFSGVASGNGSGMTPGNEVAGLATDYTVAAPSAASAVITPAALIVTANDDAKIITQGDAAGYNGVSFSGFVNGESVANLSGTHSITRSNAGTEAAGQYVGVLVPTGYSSSNYTISYMNGGYNILPAQQLLIHIQNLSSAYGTAASYAVTGAEYLDGSGASLLTLTQTAHSGNTYTFSDGLGGSATFTVAPNGAVISNAGYLAVGNYELSGINTSIGGINFAALNYVGNHTVTPIGLTPLSVARVYDGTTSMTGASLGFAGLLGSDQVLAQAIGTFHSRNAGSNVGYDISNITLSGADAGNYYLTTGALSGTDGLITPRPLTITAIADIKTFDGSTNAAGIPIVTGTLASGDSFTLLGQEYATAGVGIGLTLTPFVGIDDGNGGANYALTLVNNDAGAIRSSIDLSQVGGTQISARLNGDSASSENGTSGDSAGGVCTRGRNRNGCDEGETSGAMIEVRSTGIRLPSGLAATESRNRERPSW